MTMNGAQAMAVCRMRILLARVGGLSQEAVDIMTANAGPDSAVVLRATDIFGGRMDLGMRVTGNGLETVVESNCTEVDGDHLEVFRAFASEGCSLEVLLYLAEGVEPPAGVYPVQQSEVDWLKAYRLDVTDGEIFR